MRSAFLDDAEPEAISHAVRQVLERRGALVNEHRHSRVKFSGIKPQGLSWGRAGYVGIFQALGEREAEVRLILRARVPWRILWTVCVLNVLTLLVAILTQPAGTTWSVLAILGGLALIGASVTYVGTLKAVRAEERSLMDDFEAEFAKIPDVNVEDEEARELRELEAELEGEITRRAIQRDRPPRAPRSSEKGKRFSLFPGRRSADEGVGEGEGVGEETPEARRERLLARKAELEARRAERDAGAAPPPGEQPKP